MFFLEGFLGGFDLHFQAFDRALLDGDVAFVEFEALLELRGHGVGGVATGSDLLEEGLALLFERDEFFFGSFQAYA